MIVYFIVRNDLHGQINSGLQSEARRSHDHPAEHAVPRLDRHATAVRDQRAASAVRKCRGSRSSTRTETSTAPSSRSRTASLARREQRSGRSRNHDAFYAQDVRSEASTFGCTRRSSRVGNQPTSRSRSWSRSTGVDHELARIRLWLFLIALGGIGVASVAGFLVARTTLAPVRELSETAERVRTTRDLTQRIDVGGKRRAEPAGGDLQRDARVARCGGAAPAPARSGCLARAADAADEPAHEHRGARARAASSLPTIASNCLRDVVGATRRDDRARSAS